MVKQQERVARLDAVFGALSHPVRRDMLEAMAAGPQTVSAMAAPHGMSLAGFMKHVRTLEDAGLISCSKEGRSRSCEIVPRRLDPAAAWLSSRTTSWNDRLDALGRHLYHGAEVEHGSLHRNARGQADEPCDPSHQKERA